MIFYLSRMLFLRKISILLLIAICCACNKQQNVVSIKTNSDYEKAESFLNKRNDSAFYYFNKVATGSADSLLIARAYNSMAAIQSDAGDYFGSQQSLLLSLKFLNDHKEEDRYCLSSNYNELGNTSLNLRNYDAAINYYDLALTFSPNEDFEIVTLNNKAVAYQKTKQYSEAITIYKSIINDSRKNTKRYARILSNLARVKWLQDSGYNAAPELLAALHIREEEKDNWGLNASYAHLSDYYSASQPELALLYAGKMYGMAQQLCSPDDELEALQKLILLSSPKNTKQYFVRYQYLSDSLQASRNAAKNQFALIHFDVEKNKVDNLRLQKENAEKENYIILLALAILVLTALTVIIIILNRKRKQRTQLEAQNAIRESKLITSKKVHDVVANGLYRIIVEIEHSNTINKEELLDKIEILYEKSRDISYEQPFTNQIEFTDEIKHLLTSFSTSDIKVLLAGNEKELWNSVNEKIKNELKHVLQELMVNMRKHSNAQNVVIKFEQQNKMLHIQYTDDGIGLQPGFRKGNGLINTGNRINDIGGELTFDANLAKGLKIHIRIPIA